MLYRVLADAVVGLHGLFVVFVVMGGLLLVRWPALVWAHLPAAVWGALIEFAGWICPLTPLEKSLRARAGEVGYPGGFIEHYLLPVLYPAALTREVQLALGALVVGLNIAIYWWVFGQRLSRRRRPRRRPGRPGSSP
jgi:hypothetical protein